jgi:hypothetical protein
VCLRGLQHVRWCGAEGSIILARKDYQHASDPRFLLGSFPTPGQMPCLSVRPYRLYVRNPSLDALFECFLFQLPRTIIFLLVKR